MYPFEYKTFYTIFAKHQCAKYLNKRAMMTLDCSPNFLRGPLPFSAVSEKENYEEFLYVRIVQVSPPFTRAIFIDGSKFWKGSSKFWKVPPTDHSYEIISESDQHFQRRRFSKSFFMSVWSK